MDVRIAEADPGQPAIAALLALHLAEMHAFSPPGSVHALPADQLRAPDVTFYAAWDGDALAGVCALREIDASHGELKSMRAAPEYRGRGVGKAMLLHLLAVARARDYARVSLETGRPAPFAPAQRLYTAHGFAPCPPFADYRPDPFSLCMTREIDR